MNMDQPKADPIWCNQESKFQQKLLMVHVTFGSVQKNCAGSGICKAVQMKKFATTKLPSMSPCKSAMALVKLEAPQTLVFFFILATLCQNTIKHYFNSDLFLLESDVDIALSFAGKVRSYLIPTGIYPVERVPDYLFVRFKTGT